MQGVRAPGAGEMLLCARSLLSTKKVPCKCLEQCIGLVLPCNCERGLLLCNYSDLNSLPGQGRQRCGRQGPAMWETG